MINLKYKIIFLLIILLKFINADALTLARDSKNNFDAMEYNSNLVIFPYDDWSLMGTWSFYGLPSYTGDLHYNGLRIRDPLFGSYPVSWFNASISRISIKSNSIQIRSHSPETKELYAKFDYYQGDYGFKNFSLITGKRVSDKYSWTLYGNNVGYDGGYGLYGPYIRESGESVAQNYHFDGSFVISDWQSRVGLSYKKFRPGLLNYNQSPYAPDQQVLNWTNAGNIKQWRINNYIIFKHDSKDSMEVGVNLANYFYRYNYDRFQFRGEGRVISGKFQRDVFIKGTRLRVKIEPLLEKAYYKYHDPETQLTLYKKIGYTRKKAKSDFSFSLGAAGSAFIYDIKYNRSLFSDFSMELNSSRKFFNYPLIYDAPTDLNIENFTENNGTFLYNSANLQFNNPTVKSNSIISLVNSDIMYPYKNSVNDSIINFASADLPTLFLTQNLDISLPWQGNLRGRIIFAPETGADFLHLYSFVDYSQSLSPVFRTAAAIMPDWLGFFEYYFTQLADNMTSYLSFNSYFMRGGENLFWFQEFQNLGKISTNYFTNNKININFKFGFKVETFHIFYALYNMEGRQFSSIGGMPYHNRLQVLGVEWAFIN